MITSVRCYISNLFRGSWSGHFPVAIRSPCHPLSWGVWGKEWSLGSHSCLKGACLLTLPNERYLLVATDNTTPSLFYSQLQRQVLLPLSSSLGWGWSPNQNLSRDLPPTPFINPLKKCQPHAIYSWPVSCRTVPLCFLNNSYAAQTHHFLIVQSPLFHTQLCLSWHC